MLNRATIRMFGVLGLLALTTSAFGQIGLETKYPYTGMIKGTKVRVRAGCGEASGTANKYYYCAILNRPAKVTVVGEKNGWLAVLPPEGCYSVVLQSAVKADLTGTKGTIAKRAWARAAGTARTMNFLAGQARLNVGDTVDILGTVEGGFKYYKIKSPSSVRFWIHSSLVEKVGAAAVAAPTTTRPAGSRVGPATRPAGTGGKKPVASPPVGVTPDQLKQFRAAQAALRTEYGKAVLNRDYEGLLEKFTALKYEPKNPLGAYVKYYIQYIRSDMERLASLADARKMTTDAADAQREFEAARANVVVTVPPKPLTFDAQGVIVASRMFSGTSAVKKRYIVYDPKTKRLNAYIFASDPRVDLAGLVGKHVGVFGDSKYDKGLGAHVIDVKQTEIVNDQGKGPALDKPVVRVIPRAARPAPTTRPKTTPAPAVTPVPAVIKTPTPLTDLVPTTRPESVKPAPIIVPQTPKPAPIIRPVPPPAAKPKSVGTVDPAPKPIATPAPKTVSGAEPEFVEIVQPSPVKIAKPAPAKVGKVASAGADKPAAIVKPSPVTIVRPKPIEVVKPSPVNLPKARPVTMSKPKPITAVAKPAPKPIARPNPVTIVKPKPIAISTPITAPKIKTLPASEAAPATKPAGLIDLESISRGPTTRPAGVDAIPAPVKAVDPDDFPMPLPPSGLPLLDVKKTPTTIPANQGEFE